MCIVRGGGDLNHESFEIFKSPGLAKAILRLRLQGIFVITGLGHADDHLPADDYASLAATTPTDAAYQAMARANAKGLYLKGAA